MDSCLNFLSFPLSRPGKQVWNSAVGLHSKLLGSIHITKISACAFGLCCHNTGNVWASSIFFNPWSEHGFRFLIFLNFFFFWKHSNSVCTISSSGANTLFQKPKCGNGYKSFLCHVCSMLSFSNCAYIRQLEELEEDSRHLWMPLQLCGEKPRETRNNVNMGWGF